MAPSHSVRNKCWDLFTRSQIFLLLSGLNPLLVGQMLLKVFSCHSWPGEKEKAVEVMGAWKTQPNSAWPLSLALDCLFMDQQVSARKGEATSNRSTWHCPRWLKARYKQPSSRFSEQVLKTKTAFGRADFTLFVKGLKKIINSPTPPQEESFSN